MNIIGEALTELYRIFNILNERFYENKLPEPVLTIQKQRANNLGHFTLSQVWKNENTEDTKYEININPVNLNRPVEEIVGTLRHEMVHFANKISDIRDCNGQVHNKKFKELAENVGLICEKSKSYGYGFTALSDKLKEYITEEIKPNESVFEYFREGEPPKENKPREKKIFKYVCPSCNMVVKAKKDNNIYCGDCGIMLEMEDK